MSAEKTFNLVEIKENLSEAFKVIAENQKEKGLLPNSILVLVDYPEHNNVIGLGHPARAAATLALTTETHYKDLKKTLLANRDSNSPEVFDRVREAFNDQIETLIAELREAKI